MEVPRIPSHIEKLNKIREKINDYKAGRNRTEIEEKESGKPFKMPLFQVKFISVKYRTAEGSLEDAIDPQINWSQYNRIYLDFSNRSIIVRFKQKGKQLFSKYSEEFNFDNIITKNELIRMENNDILIVIGWLPNISYPSILLEKKLNGQDICIIYQINGVSDSDGIVDPDKPIKREEESEIDLSKDSDEENAAPIKKDKELTIREDTIPDRVNENEVIDLTIIKRVPGIIDLTGDMDEEKPIKLVSPIRSNEPVVNNTLYEGESDYASEEEEYNGIDFYERDRSPILKREISPFSNRSPFNRSISNINLSYMSPFRSSNQQSEHRQFVASPGRTMGDESNFEISLLDTEDNESQNDQDYQLSSQSTVLINQLSHQFSQSEQSEQPDPSNQPEQTHWQGMSESEEGSDFDTLF